MLARKSLAKGLEDLFSYICLRQTKESGSMGGGGCKYVAYFKDIILPVM